MSSPPSHVQGPSSGVESSGSSNRHSVGSTESGTSLDKMLGVAEVMVEQEEAVEEEGAGKMPESVHTSIQQEVVVKSPVTGYRRGDSRGGK